MRLRRLDDVLGGGPSLRRSSPEATTVTGAVPARSHLSRPVDGSCGTIVQRSRLGEKLQRPAAQRNPVLALHLLARGGHLPHAIHRVDLRPLSANPHLGYARPAANGAGTGSACFPDPKTGNFQIEWRENGHRLTRSLGHRDWMRAKKQADEFAAGFVGPELNGKAQAELEPLTLGTAS